MLGQKFSCSKKNSNSKSQLTPDSIREGTDKTQNHLLSSRKRQITTPVFWKKPTWPGSTENPSKKRQGMEARQTGANKNAETIQHAQVGHSTQGMDGAHSRLRIK